MKIAAFLIFLGLGILAMRRKPWAYATFVILGLLYFPASIGFHVNPTPCYLTVDLPLAVRSLSNFGHIILFAVFFLLTTRQFRSSDWPSLGWSLGLTMAMGVAVEVAEALSGTHQCKAIDLIPNLVGALLAATAVALVGMLASARVSRRNGEHNPVRAN